MNTKAHPPVIIIGMHRSGTSMIARMLEMLGLFVGKRKDPNHEAFFFHNINEWLFCQSNGAWDYPKPIRHLLENREVRALTSDYIRYLMKTPRVISFLGWRKYLRYRTPFNLDIPWGWKDPRNTFTLPIWLDLFPDAKVIHIYRHGVDVANSLKVRQEKILTRKKELYKRLKPFYWLRPKRGGFTDTLRCATLDGSLSLWEEYLEEARAHVRNLQSQAMELKYEDFISEPYGALKSLARFCNLTSDDVDIANVAGRTKKSRAYAYEDIPELQVFAGKVAARLKVQGY